MRLVFKLTLAIAVGVTAVLLTHGYLRVERERELMLRDLKRDQLTLAGAIAEASRAVAAQSGMQAALDLLDYVHKEDDRVFIAWARRGGDALVTGTATSVEQVVAHEAEQAFLVTRVPLVLAPRFKGQLEIRESLEPLDQRLGRSSSRVATLIAWTAGVCALIIGGLGWALVGRALRRLIAKVRRVGAGDLGGPLELRQRDEIGDLAAEIDRMCELLAEARARADDEMTARVGALEQLRHADRLSTVGKLASGVAHELGTPLNVVGARAKMIACGEAQDDKVSALIIVEQTDRMSRTIRGLLDFARQGRSRLESADLVETVESVIGFLQPIAHKNRVKLTLRDHPSTLRVAANAEQIRQVVTNLAMNAIQVQPNGGAVRLSLERIVVAPPCPNGESSAEREHARIRVEDDGPGVAAAARPHLFEPFFTTKEVGEGTGLGLSVAYGIVRDHGGWIEVDSPAGQGARFDVYLPMQ